MSSFARADGRRRGGLLLGALAVGIAIAVIVGAVASRDDESPGGSTNDLRTVTKGAPTNGSLAPDFELPRLRGPGRVRLRDLRGQTVLVNFWASWCEPCREEFPTLAEVIADHRGEELTVVGITYRDIASDSRRFAREMNAQWTLVKGGDGDPIAGDYGIRAVPQLFVIDGRGIIRDRMFGAPSRSEIERAIASARRR